MVKINYKKFAKGTYTYNMNRTWYVDIYKNPIVVKYSLDFTPKYIFCHIPGGYTSSVYDTNLYDPIFSSCYVQRTAHPKNGYISNITKTSFSIISSGQSDANEVGNQNSDSFSLTIDWIAIG